MVEKIRSFRAFSFSLRLDSSLTLFFFFSSSFSLFVVKKRAQEARGRGEAATMDNGAIIYNRDPLGDSVSNE